MGVWPSQMRIAMSTARKSSDEDPQEPVRSAPARAVEQRGLGGVARWWDDARIFLTDVRTEMRRVTWPSRREVYATTVVVLLTAMFFGLYLWGLDLALDRIVRWIFRMSGVA
jgi:preprotein translocase subunit SecE